MPYLGNQALPGLHPLSNGMAGTTPHIGYYDVAAGYSTAIGEGCLLIKTATGAQLMTIAFTAQTVIGVAACNLAASTGGKIPVYDDPNQEYSVVADAAVTAANKLAYQGRFVGITTGSNVYTSTYKQGNVTLALSTAAVASTTSLPLQIVGYVEAVGEDIALASHQVIVKINPVAHIFSDLSADRP